ncbi:MAG: cytochrome c biogenesis protein CcdA [Xylanivirga thermophila]|jgi:cytochrome c-type biogenesis protein|uniref:cytochrome c biogenesis CcdA family protein n=1 Tax=Xylanivirga thermophila TaxID=2496273 RepID=UPI0039F5FCC8
MKGSLTFVAVFFEGLASFLSPCILPLIPAYITYLAGQSAQDIVDDAQGRKRLIINSIGFVAGFSLMFIVLGAVATSIGRFLQQHRYVISKIGGIIVIFFGVFQSGLVPIPFLNYEKRLNVMPKGISFASSFLMGLVFSIGWTPCVGPLLASVLIMAGNAATVSFGMGLLAVYALGLALPFILIALMLDIIWGHIRGLYKYMGTIKLISGIVLILLGVLMLIGII